MGVIIEALSIMLNIYTFIAMLSIGCIILLFLKLKVILNRIDMSLMMQIKRSSTKNTIITLLQCIFMPGLHAAFSLMVIMFCLLNNDKSAELINMMAHEMIKKQQGEKMDNE